MKNSEIVYNKILIQIEAAKEVGLTKLAEGVSSALESKNKTSYSSIELKNDIYTLLWKAALDVVHYHDLESLDIEKVGEVLDELSNKVLSSMESCLDVDGKIGKLDYLPGQSK